MTARTRPGRDLIAVVALAAAAVTGLCLTGSTPVPTASDQRSADATTMPLTTGAQSGGIAHTAAERGTAPGARAAAAARRGLRARPATPPRLRLGSGVGLSIEVGFIARYAADLTTGDLPALMRAVGPGILRVGGRTADTNVWHARGSDHADLLDPAALHDLFTLARAADWKVMLTLPLQISTPKAVAAEAASAKAIGGAWLAGFAVGNEPDHYPGVNWHRSTPPAWLLSRWAARIAAAHRAAPGVPFVGADVTSNASEWLPDFQHASPVPLAALTLHYYAINAAHLRPGVPLSPSGLLSPLLQREEATDLHGAVLAADRGSHTPVWLDETNNVVAGGRPGVSNVQASALWTVDFALRARAAGFSGLNFHLASQLGCVRYSSICLRTSEEASHGDFRTEPQYSALLLLHSAGGLANADPHLLPAPFPLWQNGSDGWTIAINSGSATLPLGIDTPADDPSLLLELNQPTAMSTPPLAPERPAQTPHLDGHRHSTTMIGAWTAELLPA